MEELVFNNARGIDVYYLKWAAETPKAAVVISHGMAEHPERYDDLANYLTANNLTVYAINQVGHGKHAEKLGHMDNGDFDQCVDNLNELVELAKKETSLPVFLLGHSMGSFISQLYVERYHNLQGLILSGSSASSLIMKMGATIARVVYAFGKDKSKPSPFMDKMSFGSYNGKIKPARTKFDWLTHDEAIVDAYIADPLCGFVCSKGFFKEMTHGLKIMNNNKEMQKISIELPILIHGGKQDPVSNYGKGLVELEKKYKKHLINDVTLILYDNDRHEIYNELDKKTVYENTLAFINKHI